MKKNSIKFINVKKQGNKFICQLPLKEIVLLYSNALLCCNYELISTGHEEYNSTILKLNYIDRNKVSQIKDELLKNQVEDLELIFNIRSVNNPNYKYNKDEGNLIIDLSNYSIDNRTFLDVVKGYEDILGMVEAYCSNKSIGDKIIDIEIYNLPIEEIKSMIS